MDDRIVEFVVYLCLIVVAQRILAGYWVEYDDAYWHSLKRTNRKRYHSIFRRVREPHALDELEEQERFSRHSLMGLVTMEASSLILLRVFPIPIGELHSIVMFYLAPMATALVAIQWRHLDGIHSTLVGALRYLQSKGRISQDPP